MKNTPRHQFEPKDNYKRIDARADMDKDVEVIDANHPDFDEIAAQCTPPSKIANKHDKNQYWGRNGR